MDKLLGKPSAADMPRSRAEDMKAAGVTELSEHWMSTRRLSENIAAGLTREDMQLQSMPDASPTKWHLAHTTWFFETFILCRVKGYKPFHESYQFLFNSYYNSVGEQFRRPQRGVLSRPGVDEIMAYRRHVDAAMQNFLSEKHGEETAAVIRLGIHHEQQHQELMYTDIKHAFSLNPLFPALIDRTVDSGSPSPLEFQAYAGGLTQIGMISSAGEFCFDNETPAHPFYVAPFRLATRPVTNGEYAEFVADGGYRDPLLWLSDGWAWVNGSGQSAPAYWHRKDGAWFEYTLAGLVPLSAVTPVCHVNYYEACAFAAWAGKRLPTEQEWELAAKGAAVAGNLLDPERLHPRPAGTPGVTQLFGDVWEWTCSAYAAYPGFKPARGALGEYNGKFMCGQYVLRGGSCVTPPGHIRVTYRNFFYPHSTWQFSGIRLAEDG